MQPRDILGFNEEPRPVLSLQHDLTRVNVQVRAPAGDDLDPLLQERVQLDKGTVIPHLSYLKRMPEEPHETARVDVNAPPLAEIQRRLNNDEVIDEDAFWSAVNEILVPVDLFNGLHMRDDSDAVYRDYLSDLVDRDVARAVNRGPGTVGEATEAVLRARLRDWSIESGRVIFNSLQNAFKLILNAAAAQEKPDTSFYNYASQAAGGMTEARTVGEFVGTVRLLVQALRPRIHHAALTESDPSIALDSVSRVMALYVLLPAGTGDDEAAMIVRELQKPQWLENIAYYGADGDLRLKNQRDIAQADFLQYYWHLVARSPLQINRRHWPFLAGPNDIGLWTMHGAANLDTVPLEPASAIFEIVRKAGLSHLDAYVYDYLRAVERQFLRRMQRVVVPYGASFRVFVNSTEGLFPGFPPVTVAWLLSPRWSKMKSRLVRTLMRENVALPAAVNLMPTIVGNTRIVRVGPNAPLEMAAGREPVVLTALVGVERQTQVAPPVFESFYTLTDPVQLFPVARCARCRREEPFLLGIDTERTPFECQWQIPAALPPAQEPHLSDERFYLSWHWSMVQQALGGNLPGVPYDFPSTAKALAARHMWHGADNLSDDQISDIALPVLRHLAGFPPTALQRRVVHNETLRNVVRALRGRSTAIHNRLAGGDLQVLGRLEDVAQALYLQAEEYEMDGRQSPTSLVDHAGLLAEHQARDAALARGQNAPPVTYRGLHLPHKTTPDRFVAYRAPARTIYAGSASLAADAIQVAQPMRALHEKVLKENGEQDGKLYNSQLQAVNPHLAIPPKDVLI